MAAPTSVSNKPRRLRGTPSYRFRNYFAAGVLTVGVAIFAGLYAIVSDPVKNEKIRLFLKDTEEEKDRRALMSLVKPNRAEEILKKMEEAEEVKRTL